MTSQKKIKILHFIAPGYSGSTLMGLCLGKHPNIINWGEVINLKSDYNERKVYTCKKTLPNCPFWSEVKNCIDLNRDSQYSFDLSSSGKYEDLDRAGELSQLSLLVGRSTTNNFSSEYTNFYRKKNKKFFSTISTIFPYIEFFVDLSKRSDRLEII